MLPPLPPALTWTSPATEEKTGDGLADLLQPESGGYPGALPSTPVASADANPFAVLPLTAVPVALRGPAPLIPFELLAASDAPAPTPVVPRAPALARDPEPGPVLPPPASPLLARDAEPAAPALPDAAPLDLLDAASFVAMSPPLAGAFPLVVPVPAAVFSTEPQSVLPPERRGKSLAGRLIAINQALAERPIEGLVQRKASLATRAMLERVHSPKYLDRIWWLRAEAGRVYEKRAVLPGSLEQILWSVGSVSAAVESVLAGESRRAAAFVEPPGHHAEIDRSMGFCAINNVAVAVAHAIATHRLERVLVVDWDVHHGNGTQQAFESRRDVCFVDLHEHPLFPGSGLVGEAGRGDGLGYTVNVPLPTARTDADYLFALRSVLEPLCAWYRPQLIVVSCGFDAHEADPLGGMRVTAGGFAAMTGVVCALADEYAEGRLVLALEGGYNVEAVAQSAHACAAVLAGGAAPVIEGVEDAAVRAVVDEVRTTHRALAPGAWA